MFKRLKNWLIKKLGGCCREDFSALQEELSILQEKYDIEHNDVIGLIASLNKAEAALKKYEDEHTYFTKEAIYDRSNIITVHTTTSVPRRFFYENKSAVSDMILAGLCKSEELKDCVYIKTLDDTTTPEPTVKVRAELRLLQRR